MTVEIAIMNKEAVALATDSAVTSIQPGGHKIFPSANKLFALSKYHPVGMMVYGNARLMDVPWETIIKIYRSTLSKRKFDTIDSYAEDFIKFLNNARKIFPKIEQDKYFKNIVRNFFKELICENIRKSIEEIIKKDGKINIQESKKIVSSRIHNYHSFLKEKQKLAIYPKNYSGRPKRRYDKNIRDICAEIFENLPITEKDLLMLVEIAVYLFTKDFFPSNVSGIVFAGFGHKENFPSIQSYKMECLVGGRLKYKYEKDISGKIDFQTGAIIIPFAQSGMIHTFMRGVDPDYMKNTQDWLREVFNKYPDLVADAFQINDETKKKLLVKSSKALLEDLLKKMDKHIFENHIDPVTNIVSILPKNELADMAENLVSLTSFKKRISLDLESVGGPIDVAVISKGDGYIWIKRKHYFNKDYNIRFISHYFSEDENGKNKKQI